MITFEVVKGTWIHTKSGKAVEVIGGPYGVHQELRLRHPSGRETNKMLHYFIEEYRRPENFQPSSKPTTGG